ncbi:hypothetical protein CQW23_23689 [Capsicum baccatum]|uniref:Receptor-like protein 12 n=1 Tax=Capsicum baccatum TaxID=33114 RepID=A0A2G2VSM8_CAPBA|nr:hypothetical protein CQW23_23689 [Capsicum baccatum]
MEIVKIFVAFTSIDFSCNNFQGDIPETLGNLKPLYHLNFSHNALTGRLPKSLGKLTQLESLDVSVNQLSGRIPDELASLTFLSFLNLSFNQTGLCDFPLKKTCSETNATGSSQFPSRHSEHETVDEKYISFALGSSAAFGIITWLLLHSRKYNELIDRLLFRILGPREKSSRDKKQRRSRRVVSV